MDFAIGPAIGAGVVGAIAMLLIIYGGRAMGMTRMDLLYTLGTMMGTRASRGQAYVLGAMLHLMMGAIFGLAHAGILVGFAPATVGGAVGLDAIVGLVHGMGVVVVMPLMLNAVHPLVASGGIEPPGTALVGFGTMTPMGVVMAHLVFGLVTGGLYAAWLL